MFENLSERLERSFKILKGEGKITEINVAETLKDVRRALLDADVNYKVAKQFTDTVKTKALGQDVLTAVKPGQLMVKIVHDELATLMGGETAEVNLSQNPSIILMSGLQGSGKTTFSGKLAKMLKSKKGKRPLLVACDVYRPAAIEQLKVLGEQIDVPVYTEEDSKDPVSISANAVKYAKENHFDLVIVDTAGRLAIDEQMMNEIEAIKKKINPTETLFVVDSMMTGTKSNRFYTICWTTRSNSAIRSLRSRLKPHRAVTKYILPSKIMELAFRNQVSTKYGNVFTKAISPAEKTKKEPDLGFRS